MDGDNGHENGNESFDDDIDRVDMPITVAVVGPTTSGKSLALHQMALRSRTRRSAVYSLTSKGDIPRKWNWIVELRDSAELAGLSDCAAIIDDCICPSPQFVRNLRVLLDKDARHSNVDVFVGLHTLYGNGLHNQVAQFRYAIFTKAASNRKSVSAVTGMVGQAKKIMREWDEFLAGRCEFGYFCLDLRTCHSWTTANPSAVADIVFATEAAKRRWKEAESAEADPQVNEERRKEFQKLAAVEENADKALVLFDMAFGKNPAKYVDETLRLKVRGDGREFSVHAYDLIHCVLTADATPCREIRAAFLAAYKFNPSLPVMFVPNRELSKLMK